MTLFLSKWDGHVILRARAESDGIIGDAQWELEPGQIVFGKTYEEWSALPAGSYEYPEPASFADDDYSEAIDYLTEVAKDLGLADTFESGTATPAELRSIVHEIAERAAGELRTEAESLVAELGPVPFSDLATFGIRDKIRGFFAKALKVVKTASLAAALTLMGPQELTVEESKILTAQVVAQESYLKNFEAQVVAGSQSPEGIPARAAMYGHAVWGTALNTQRQVVIDSGEMTEEINILGGENHCEECPAESAKGWVPIGTLKPIGSRQCLVLCRCHIETR